MTAFIRTDGASCRRSLRTVRPCGARRSWRRWGGFRSRRARGGVSVALEHGRATFEARNEAASANIVLGDCQVEDGAKCVFRVNPRLLKEALGVIDDTTFALWFADVDGTPLTLRCGISWVSVVMPYRNEG